MDETSVRSENDSVLEYYPKLELIDRKLIKQLVEDTVDWAHAHGMVMKTETAADRGDICQIAPCTLFPSPFPYSLFQEAMDIQQAFSLLYFRISWDFDFLIKSHAEVVKTDDFTKHFVEILNAVRTSDFCQRKTLMIQRNDYMCHEDNYGNRSLKQIEVNNIAASMGSLAERATCVHRRTLETLQLPNKIIEKAILNNHPTVTVAKGICEAWYDYGVPEAIILFVVEDANQNQIDQRHVEYCIDELSSRSIRCLRITLTDGAKRLKVNETNHYLVLDNMLRVAVVYFRAGYSPNNYPTEAEWTARRIIELSDAVKCPWIGLQLANTKKIQQVLSENGVLERYITDGRMSTRIRKTFAGMWGLENDDDRTQKIIQDAVTHPEKFVLKPQLEGGGGNYYGKEVAEKLKTMSRDEMAAYIIMERITPMVVKNYVIRPRQEPVLMDVVGELGIYAYLYGSPAVDYIPAENVITNYVSGHIIRSKDKNVDKGGVAIGAAVIDSPYLF
ncbi:glutathione synthetase [Loa loa]|uniref:Glutathione synthetase n=1 Tax=Loa loa TaxID=7209 RepID=A0A1I7V6Q8_LOALO|nr:glutathione synthetase [Loa loa]EFO21448.1 glutathione synthetase [Loa loa]